MAEFFADGHLRFLDGEWRDENGDVVDIRKNISSMWRIIDRSEYGVEAECGHCKYNAIFSRVSVAKFCPNCGADMRGVVK